MALAIIVEGLDPEDIDEYEGGDEKEDIARDVQELLAFEYDKEPGGVFLDMAGEFAPEDE